MYRTRCGFFAIMAIVICCLVFVSQAKAGLILDEASVVDTKMSFGAIFRFSPVVSDSFSRDFQFWKIIQLSVLADEQNPLAPFSSSLQIVHTFSRFGPAKEANLNLTAIDVGDHRTTQWVNHYDFNDFYVLDFARSSDSNDTRITVSGLHAAPEPASSLLLVVGLLPVFFGILARRRPVSSK